MKRFCYDCMLLFIIIVIGLSLTQTNEVVLQEDLIQYETQLEKKDAEKSEEKVATKEHSQTNENQASLMAKGMSEVIRYSFSAGVKVIYLFFENIMN